MKKVFISIIICTIANIIFAQTSFNNVTTITPSSLPQLNGNIYYKDNITCLLYGYDHVDQTCIACRESEVISFAARNIAVAKYGSWDAAEFTPVFIENRATITNNIEQNLLSVLNIVKTQGIPSISFEPDRNTFMLNDEEGAAFDASLNTINYGKLQSANDTNLFKNILDKGYPIIVYFQSCPAYNNALTNTNNIWGEDSGPSTGSSKTIEPYLTAVIVGYTREHINGYARDENRFIMYCPNTADGEQIQSKSTIIKVPFDTITANVLDYAIVPHSLSPYKYPTEIEGPDYLACTKTYQVSNLPPTATISWRKESFYLNISAGQNTSMVTINPVHFAAPNNAKAFNPGLQIQSPKLIASITINGKNIELSKSLEVVNNVAPSLTIKESLFLSRLIVGSTYTFQVNNANNFNENSIVWDITLPNGTKQYRTGTEVKITPTSGGTLRINIENIDGCEPNNMASYSYSTISLAYMQYNNPATETLYVQIVEQNENSRGANNELNYSAEEYTLELYDKNTTLVRKINVPQNALQIQIPISDLTPGYYYLRLLIDNQVVDIKQIIIN